MAYDPQKARWCRWLSHRWREIKFRDGVIRICRRCGMERHLAPLERGETEAYW
jgi:hypothetical protein